MHLLAGFCDIIARIGFIIVTRHSLSSLSLSRSLGLRMELFIIDFMIHYDNKFRQTLVGFLAWQLFNGSMPMVKTSGFKGEPSGLWPNRPAAHFVSRFCSKCKYYLIFFSLFLNQLDLKCCMFLIKVSRWLSGVSEVQSWCLEFYIFIFNFYMYLSYVLH